ncbi:phenylalanine--tRNA ligase subunit beta [Cryomorphaceae bacterium 1068]|nr:phenylalanine--tRNA ligase subunit beta [Cryomorphaceae bacterium 1068]
MKVSYNWLKNYLSFDLSPEEVSEILTDTGLEIEKLEPFESVPGGLKGVVVGHVTEAVQHPNADKLKVTKVDVGTGQLLNIVCGAPNVAQGQKVLVATVGTTLMPEPDKPFKIKKAKIRGEESFGMICAEDELGIGESHDGIMVLPEDTSVGEAAADILEVENDYVFEIGLTPNRTDAFGHYGVARDLAARLSLKNKVRATLPEVKVDIADGNPIIVKIEDADGCGQYAGLYIESVKVEPSPGWLQNRLRAIGLQPINTVVDVTNYVLHELGHPLHAFDADKIDGNTVFVKTLPEGTKFKTLDELERNLSSEDLMICDAKGGLCIAGVFGGIGSGVSEETTNVFLESAWFNPSRVRKTAKRHALNTDASFRYERGVDHEMTLFALKRAAQLIQELAGGTVRGPINHELTKLPEQSEISITLKRINDLCGANISAEELENILSSLDFEFEKSGEWYQLKVPSYRVDVTREADVVEEVLRIYGYNAIALPERMSISVSIPQKPEPNQVMQSLANSLSARGFSEIMSNGLTESAKIQKVVGEELAKDLVAMLNPLSMELDVLRPTLAISSLESISYNLNRQAERLMFYEIGTAYQKAEKAYKETLTLSIALVGDRFRESWNNQGQPFSYSDLSGEVKGVFEIMGITDLKAESGTHSFMTDVTVLKKGEKPFASFGVVSPRALKTYGIKKPVLFAEIDLTASLRKMKHATKTVDDLPKFPTVRRDLSLLLNKNIPFAEIEKLAFAKAGNMLKEVGLFDVYEGKNLPEGKKSYAISFTLRDEKKTLTDKKIEQTMAQIQSELETALGAELR